jgi:phosphohistidine phosphatase
MKKILLVRHAKSSWTNLSLSDHDRKLDDRGIRDAPIMAQKMKDLNYLVQGIYTSSATRAKETAEYFAENHNVEKIDFHILPKLYHSLPDTMMDVIADADDQYDTIAIFCHNPGITYFAYSILDQDIDNISTCGILLMESSVNSWNEVKQGNLNFLKYYYPKM